MAKRRKQPEFNPLASRHTIMLTLQRGARGERFSRYPAGIFAGIPLLTCGRHFVTVFAKL